MINSINISDTQSVTHSTLNADSISNASNIAEIYCSLSDNGIAIKPYPNEEKIRSDGRNLYIDKANTSTYIIPEITNVEIKRDNIGAPRVVIVTFADGKAEKATLDGSDIFTLEQGVSICITKKILSTKGVNGSNTYNKIVKRALKVFEREDRNRYNLAMSKEIEEQNRKNRAEKKRLRKEKKEKEARERQIDIQKEAYLRAMREYMSST